MSLKVISYNMQYGLVLPWESSVKKKKLPFVPVSDPYHAHPETGISGNFFGLSEDSKVKTKNL